MRDKSPTIAKSRGEIVAETTFWPARVLLLAMVSASPWYYGSVTWQAQTFYMPAGIAILVLAMTGAVLRKEAIACFVAAGMDYAPLDEYTARVNSHYKAQPVGGLARTGSSTLQSVLRGHTTVEVDYLNGEIELLGVLHGLPTPYNSAVRKMAVEMAARGMPPGSRTLDDVRRLAQTNAATPPRSL